MVRICIATLAMCVLTMAAPQPQLSPDPNGDDNVGNGQGLQFITGGCLSDADCASGCCAGLASGDAVCSGPDVGNAQGKQGCGFGGAGADAGAGAGEEDVAEPPAGGADGADGAGGGANTGEAGSENVGQGNGSQFITGQCTSDADCASGCCAGSEGSDTGACSAVLVAEENGKTGCGFSG